MTITVLNANHPQYWIDVKRRASIRKACKLVWEQISVLKFDYDRCPHILNLAEINRSIRWAAKFVGIEDVAGFVELKAHFVEELDLPAEILTSTEAEIEADEKEAIEIALECEQERERLGL